jgi:hypothetical protein
MSFHALRAAFLFVLALERSRKSSWASSPGDGNNVLFAQGVIVVITPKKGFARHFPLLNFPYFAKYIY